MKNRLRVTLLSALCAVGVLTSTPLRSDAQPSKEAEAHNDAGKALFKERRYFEAYRRFQQAVALSPEGRFYFNVCFSLNYLERFQEAIEACEQVQPNGADEALLKKTDAVLAALRAKVPATPPPVDPNTPDPNTGTPLDPNTGTPVDPNTGTPVDPNTGTPVDPNTGTPVDPNTGTPVGPNAGQAGPAQVPGLDPFAAKKPTGKYAWALGAAFTPLVNLGMGDGEAVDGVYAPGGIGLNLFANFMYKAEQQLGLQGNVSFSNIGAADDFGEAINIVDFGGAVYKHIPVNDKIDVTPLVGLHVSLMQPDSSTEEGLLAFGFKLQGSIDYYLGAQKAHVVSFAPTVKGYSAAASGSGPPAEAFGLDSGGVVVEFGIGYQYRFTSPFGSGPLFTLE